MPVIRPMTEDDVRAALDLTIATFEDSRPPQRGARAAPGRHASRSRKRYSAFVRTRPGGLVGGRGRARASRAARWRSSARASGACRCWSCGPALQSAGVGSELLRRAHDYAHDARGRIILASPDPRAIRAYSRLGLDLHPCFVGQGTPRDVRAPEGMREGGARRHRRSPRSVDRFARGGGHGPSIETLLAMGQTLLVLPERGYAVFGDGDAAHARRVRRRERRARSCAARWRAPERTVTLGYFTAAQQWAMPVCLEAGLDVCGANGVASSWRRRRRLPALRAERRLPVMCCDTSSP